MGDDALREAEHEARLEAAPFAVLVVLALVALALASLHTGWELVGGVGWWLWLLAAVPYALLSVILLAGIGRVQSHDRRRTIVLTLLGVVVVCSLFETGLLVASLVSSANLRISGPQLLHSATTLWLSNVVAFGLAFWEMDCGGPVRRALSDARRAPDIQFPQDENPDLARPGWVPHLLDYLYLFDDELGRLQPHRRDAPDPTGQGADGGRGGRLGRRGAPDRRTGRQHPAHVARGAGRVRRGRDGDRIRGRARVEGR